MKIVLIKVTKDTVIISLKMYQEITIENGATQHACTKAVGNTYFTVFCQHPIEAGSTQTLSSEGGFDPSGHSAQFHTISPGKQL